VLLVDDDESLRRALARAIRLAGFQVEAFSSAEALLARGIREHDACLVLDIDLPGIDGVSCQKMLEATGHDLPTVFITGLSFAEVRDPIFARKAVAVLYKPFNKDDLIVAIEQACA